MARTAAATKPAKQEAIILFTPEMHVINEHLFTKSAYVDPKTEKEGTPMYSIELAAQQDSADFGNFIDDVADKVIEKYGKNIFLSVVDKAVDGAERVRSPFLDGNALKRKREDKGKTGDAYANTFVIRANTAFNWAGQDADGGITVLDEDVQRITPFQNAKDDGTFQVYNGCYGIAKVELSFYDDNEGNPACKFYLKAFQKTRDGEPLISVQDHSEGFQKVGRATAEEGGRRSRRG